MPSPILTIACLLWWCYSIAYSPQQCYPLSKPHKYLVFHSRVYFFPDSVFHNRVLLFQTPFSVLLLKHSLRAILWDTWVLLYNTLYLKTGRYTVIFSLIIEYHWILNSGILWKYTSYQNSFSWTPFIFWSCDFMADRQCGT